VLARAYTVPVRPVERATGTVPLSIK
jgi:hypothetical protein